MKTLATLLLAIASALSLHAGNNLTQYVNPYIGTGGHGHVFLGANVPFGYVQLGPTEPLRGWDWCSGYHYSDNTIIGFAHAHMSGTGIGERGDVGLLPMNSVKQDSVKFSHDDETVRPGYYAVKLNNPDVLVELTASQRAGMHRYTFNGNGRKLIKIDLKQGIGWDALTACDFHQTSPTRISGLRFSTGWAVDQRVYFAAEFSQPVKRVYGDKTSMVVELTDATRPLVVKVGMSGVSEQNAQLNADTEMPSFDFDAQVAKADEAWNAELSRVEIDTDDADARTIFYTAMYHAFLAPSVYNDVNGDYRGSDTQVHHGDYTNYTTFSLWDTYRAEFPMLSIVQSEKMKDMAETFMNIYRQSGKLPIWHFDGNENHCMVGNPGVIILADLVLKGFVDNAEEAYQALKTSALKEDRGLKLFNEYGYIPYDLDEDSNETVARALEYAIADAGVARVAKMLGHDDDYKHFLWRSEAYKRLFDPATGFLRAKDSKGEFRPGFNPFNTEHRQNDYCEGNAWQYAWLVPHDVKGLAGMFKNEKAFEAKLDSLFTLDASLMGDDVSPDVSGLIGQYAHGNEPSHHVIYMYNYVNQHRKAAKLLRQTMKTMYKNDFDGLSGNEDVGQMSAWFVMSAMGLYQVEPSGTKLAIGSPLFKKAVIKLPGGKSFTINTIGNSGKNCVIKSAKLNSKPLKTMFIDYKNIVAGGELTLVMGK